MLRCECVSETYRREEVRSAVLPSGVNSEDSAPRTAASEPADGVGATRESTPRDSDVVKRSGDAPLEFTVKADIPDLAILRPDTG
ncbi:hypothetical protein R1flu_023235 [Riccia fluitans]|uniref:Uncharacterized protein n=1 Tax=Riccia fluitans TaxID=41844 RepID=A0ABD1XRG8_9MARC